MNLRLIYSIITILLIIEEIFDMLLFVEEEQCTIAEYNINYTVSQSIVEVVVL